MGKKINERQTCWEGRSDTLFIDNVFDDVENPMIVQKPTRLSELRKIQRHKVSIQTQLSISIHEQQITGISIFF